MAVIALPVTMFLMSREMDLRQHAAGDVITGTVYNDANNNKTMDNGETGIPNAKVDIYYFASDSATVSPSVSPSIPPSTTGDPGRFGGRNIFFKQIPNRGRGQNQGFGMFGGPRFKTASVATDANGVYTYKPELADMYIVRVEVPKGYTVSGSRFVRVNNLNNTVDFGLKQYSFGHVFPSGTPRNPRASGTPPIASPSVTPTCIPRPSCLDQNPACEIAEPATGWCPTGDGFAVPTPPPSCIATPPPQCDSPVIPIPFGENEDASVGSECANSYICPDTIPMNDDQSGSIWDFFMNRQNQQNVNVSHAFAPNQSQDGSATNSSGE